MLDPVAALVGGAVHAGLAAFLAFVLFRLINVKGRATRAVDYGRKWAAWICFITTVTLLPKFFRDFQDPDSDSLALWSTVTFALGLVAFIAGSFFWLHSRSRTKKHLEINKNGLSGDSKNVIPVPSPEYIPTNRTSRQGPDSADTNTGKIFLEETPQTNLDKSEEDFYAQAFDELESENRKTGLWAKSFAEAQGNESLAKAKYLKVRAEQLAKDDNDGRMPHKNGIGVIL